MLFQDGFFDALASCQMPTGWSLPWRQLPSHKCPQARTHVETDRAIQDHARELKQGVERECANVRLGPSPPQTLPI